MDTIPQRRVIGIGARAENSGIPCETSKIRHRRTRSGDYIIRDERGGSLLPSRTIFF
jgi:hypothetical protein